MKQKNIVETLVTMLRRQARIVTEVVGLYLAQNSEFLLLIVTFLKKLSIFVENKDEVDVDVGI